MASGHLLHQRPGEGPGTVISVVHGHSSPAHMCLNQHLLNAGAAVQKTRLSNPYLHGLRPSYMLIGL